MEIRRSQLQNQTETTTQLKEDRISHFVRCVLEGLRQACAKPLNYGKLADIEQKEKEAPGKFLDRLREAPRRFTEIDPKSEEGQVILKDRFLTQSAPDILHKLLKRALEQINL